MKVSIINAVAGVLVLVAILGIILVGGLNELRLSLNCKYTIAITRGEKPSTKGKWIDYVLTVENVEYYRSQRPLKHNPQPINGRYYVKFLPSDPTISRIMWDKPVPEHITESPPEGWEKIPE